MIQQFYLDRLYFDNDGDIEHGYKIVNSDGNYFDLDFIEEQILKFVNRKYAVAVSNCTNALTLILMSKNYPQNSLIALPSYTYRGTASAIELAGHIPVAIDIKNNYHINQIDLQKKKYFKDIKAMIAVSLFGNPLDKNKYWSFCHENQIDLIEDAAQSFSAWNSGTVGMASALSFSPTKPFPVLGHGGMILTDDQDIYLSCKENRKKYNFFMDSKDARTLSLLLGRYDEYNERRHNIADFYTRNIDSEHTMVAPIEDFGGNSFSKFIVHSKKNLLNLKDVQVLKHYPYLIEETPNAERLRKLTYSLPIDPYLEDEELSKIVDAINHMPT